MAFLAEPADDRAGPLLTVCRAVVGADDRVEPGRTVEDGRDLRANQRGQPGIREPLADGAEGRRRHDGVADQVGAEDRRSSSARRAFRSLP